jgi:hypothetical protein
MPDLHELLASSIVCALEEREHVIVAPGCADALCAALEPVVAKGIPAFVSPLLSGRDEESRPALVEARRVMLQHALDDTAKRVAALLLATDHVDDIFGDVLRAMRGLLRGVQRGEIDVDEPPESGAPAHDASAPGGDGSPAGSSSWRPPAPALGSARGSWRPGAHRSDPAGLLGDDAAASAADGQLGYFLDNLERSLSVLEEFGEGPPSAPATLGAHTEPPPADDHRATRERRSAERTRRDDGTSAERPAGARARPARPRGALSGTLPVAASDRPRGRAARKDAAAAACATGVARRKTRTAAAPATRDNSPAPDGSKRVSTADTTASSVEPPRRRAAAGGTRAKR